MRDFFHHLFLPRESNNHRARALHHLSLFLLIVALLIGNIAVSYLEKNHSSILGITANFTQDDLLLQTNAKRAENGLPPLQLNAQLSQAAYLKGQDMLAKNYWAHNSPDGTTPWVFIKNSGYEYLYAGENLARGFSSAPDVVNAWMNSQGHRENILSANYDEVGFAVVTGTLTGDETILVVQEFGRKMTGTPEPPENIASNTIETRIAPTAILTPIVTSIRFPSPTIVLPSPTPVIVQITSPTPSPSADLVASVQSNPLVDANAFSKNFSLLVVGFLLLLFVLDIIYIERKKITRVLSHNIDHIMFLAIIMLILVIIGQEAVL